MAIKYCMECGTEVEIESNQNVCPYCEKSNFKKNYKIDDEKNTERIKNKLCIYCGEPLPRLSMSEFCSEEHEELFLENKPEESIGVNVTGENKSNKDQTLTPK
jgi:hypothetical protein